MENQLIDKWGEWIDVAGLAIGDSDVYITFNGKNACSLKDGKNNPLYGRRINLTVLYGEMIDDVIEYIQSDEFLNDKSKMRIVSNAMKYTTKKYGSSIEWVYNRLFNDNKSFVGLTTDKLFQMMIDRVGSVEKIDWIKMYKEMPTFITGNESILIYIAKEILKGDIYKYFVINYNLRVVGVKSVNKFYKYENRNYTVQHIVLKWEIDGITKEREIQLGRLMRNKRDWWQHMTNNVNTRGKIVDYDKLLNKKDENEVLPNRCPIDNNIILNYTGIDFSANENKNMNECKNNYGLTETWSFASIDRIDSTREYDYNNIQIISQYYNHLKNCGSFEQLDKLHNYQFKIKSELCSIEYMI